MARPRTEKVTAAKSALMARLQNHLRLPGERFVSARAVVGQFGISYQTAHRILKELEDEGHLRRSPGVGTFLPGNQAKPSKVQLIFSARARRAGSFGGHLLGLLRPALESKNIATSLTWDDGGKLKLRDDHYPVVWESEHGLAMATAARRFGMVLNDAPPAGIGASLIDALSCDDRSGGALAAQYLAHQCGRSGRFAVLAGPRDDHRSENRVAGFLRELPDTHVTYSNGWFFDHGTAHAGEVLARNPDGVFCCNDRLAEALLAALPTSPSGRPRVIGFDDAPIAEKIGLTTIGLPWTEIAETVADIASERIAGRQRPARHTILAHRLVTRESA